MATATAGVRNADAPKRKAGGKPFEKGNRVGTRFGEGQPRNQNGQRSAAVVRFGVGIRELLVQVGEETTTLSDGRQISKIEGLVRAAYKQAIEGDHNARTFIVERVEGKVAQPMDVNTSGVIEHSIAVDIVKIYGGITAEHPADPATAPDTDGA